MAYGYLRSGYRRRSFRPRVVYVSGSSSRRRPSAKSRSRRKTRSTRKTASTSTQTTDTKKMTGTGHGDKYVLSQADPFDENVDGVKIPDANAQPSVPLKAEDTFDVAINASETTRAIGINPTLNKTFYGSATNTASAWTWGSSYAGTVSSTKLSQLRSDFELFRPVAHACRITSGLAPTAAKGFLHVAVFTMSTFGQTTWPCPTTISELQSVPGYKRYPIGRLTAEGVTVVNRPLDCTAQRYIDTDNDIYGSSATNEFNVPCQWGTIIIAVTGCDASTVPVSIENIIHSECIPRSTSISQATSAAKYNVAALAAAANAQSKTQASALDSEKPMRKANALQHALNGLGVMGRGKSYDVGKVHVNKGGWPTSRPTDGIRNSVSSGML